MSNNSVIKEENGQMSNNFVPLLNIVSSVLETSNSEIVLDLSGAEHFSPFCVLALLVYLQKSKKRISFINENPYLKEIAFADFGIKSDEVRRTEFIAMMEGFSRKTILPIVSFPSTSMADDNDFVSTVVEDLLVRQLGIGSNVAIGLKYVIEETLDNVTEHAQSPRGFFLSRAYPECGLVDICIADLGITLLGSYQRMRDNGIESDIEAIKAANRGISSKNLPEVENRGYGIYTSKRMLIDGLKGEYTMISGNSLYTKSLNVDKFYEFPEGLRFEGTIVGFRLHYMAPDFNYIQFVE